MHQFWNVRTVPRRKKRPQPLKLVKCMSLPEGQIKRRPKGFERIIQNIEKNAGAVVQHKSRSNQPSSIPNWRSQHTNIKPMMAYRLYWTRVLADLVPKKTLHYKLPYIWRNESSQKTWKECTQQFNNSNHHNFLSWLDCRMNPYKKSCIIDAADAANELSFSQLKDHPNSHVLNIFKNSMR